mgnify:CR=1 FL=1
MASICGSPVCAGGKPKMKFTYTGDYVVRKDGVVELLTSGTLVFLEPKVIDLFMVGGGGAGGVGQLNAYRGLGGGGGGYTRTVRKVNVTPNTGYPVTVGSGGVVTNNVTQPTNGGASAFGNFSAGGGISAVLASSSSAHTSNGGAGGSGGGGGVYSNSDYGTGGSNGEAGEQGTNGAYGGAGQGFTTREFGEAAGKLYAGGGGGGRFLVSSTPVVSLGGSGGGGSGGFTDTNSTVTQAADAGGANTGGGGGGGTTTDMRSILGGAGGSGIVCFRESAELPELSGTWVLNERLYRPDEAFVETNNFEVSLNGTSFSPCTKVTFESRALFLNITNAGNLNVYSFNDNRWSRSYKYWKFTAAQASSFSDKFRTWLASNASKQA